MSLGAAPNRENTRETQLSLISSSSYTFWPVAPAATALACAVELVQLHYRPKGHCVGYSPCINNMVSVGKCILSSRGPTPKLLDRNPLGSERGRRCPVWKGNDVGDQMLFISWNMDAGRYFCMCGPNRKVVGMNSVNLWFQLCKNNQASDASKKQFLRCVWVQTHSGNHTWLNESAWIRC